jgi:hypothetical protein
VQYRLREFIEVVVDLVDPPPLAHRILVPVKPLPVCKMPGLSRLGGPRRAYSDPFLPLPSDVCVGSAHSLYLSVWMSLNIIVVTCTEGPQDAITSIMSGLRSFWQ